MKLNLSNRVFLAAIILLLAFLVFRGFQFTQAVTSFLNEHFWEAIF